MPTTKSRRPRGVKSGVMNDDQLLAGVLRRFLQAREFFFVKVDHLTLDGKVDINEDEVGALLRVTEGWLESHRVAGQADESYYVREA